MAVAPVRYKIIEGDSVFDPVKALPKRQWYIRLLTGNNEIALAGEGLDDIRSAEKTCESIWIAHAKGTQSQYSALDRGLLLERCPVPYTKDSERHRVTKNPTVLPRDSAVLGEVLGAAGPATVATARKATPAEAKKFATVKKQAKRK